MYTANISAIHGKDINASGEFYFNFREKLLQLELNKTAGMNNSEKYKFLKRTSPRFVSNFVSECFIGVIYRRQSESPHVWCYSRREERVF